MTRREELRGRIWNAGFASGDRLVVGTWDESPIGRMADVMWADPAGHRTLLAPTKAIADYISAVYVFDQVTIVPFDLSTTDTGLHLIAGELALSIDAGGEWPLPLGVFRPAWFTRYVESPIAQALFGVRTYGVSPTGVHEWYRADGIRFVRQATGAIQDESLGALQKSAPPSRFGFSEAPNRAAVVRVRPLLVFP